MAARGLIGQVRNVPNAADGRKLTGDDFACLRDCLEQGDVAGRGYAAFAHASFGDRLPAVESVLLLRPRKLTGTRNFLRMPEKAFRFVQVG